MDEFEDKFAASRWASDIHILGYVSDGELAWLYQHCLVNLYPSHYEGFGLPGSGGDGIRGHYHLLQWDFIARDCWERRDNTFI